MRNKFGHEEASRCDGNVSVPQSDGFHVVRGGRGDRVLFAPSRSSKSLKYWSKSFVGRRPSTPNLRFEQVLRHSAEASGCSENAAVLSFGTLTVGWHLEWASVRFRRTPTVERQPGRSTSLFCSLSYYSGIYRSESLQTALCKTDSNPRPLKVRTFTQQLNLWRQPTKTKSEVQDYAWHNRSARYNIRRVLLKNPVTRSIIRKMGPLEDRALILMTSEYAPCYTTLPASWN